MERTLKEQNFDKGDVVTVPFPFTNLENAKIRPALVIGIYKENINIIMITSQTRQENEIILENKDFCLGSLPNNPSYIRIDMIANIDRKLILEKKGQIKNEKLEEVIKKRIEFITQPRIVDKTSKLKAFIKFKKYF